MKTVIVKEGSDKYYAGIIDEILSRGELNQIMLSRILGIPLTKIVLKEGFSDEETSELDFVEKELQIYSRPVTSNPNNIKA